MKVQATNLSSSYIPASCRLRCGRAEVSSTATPPEGGQIGQKTAAGDIHRGKEESNIGDFTIVYFDYQQPTNSPY